MRGLLSELIQPSPRAVITNVMDDRYWYPLTAALSTTGIRITPELALMCSCLYQGTRLIAETIASLPVKVYRETGEDTKELARTNPLWPLLRRRPNSWQTPHEFFAVMTGMAILWTNAFAEIIPGPRGAVEELVPIWPDMVELEQLPSRRIVYHVTDPTTPGRKRTLVQEQMFHLRGFGLSPTIPTPLLKLAREAIGLWVALEQFETAFFRQGARPGLVYQHPGPKAMSEEAYKRLDQSIREKHAGVEQMQKPILLEEGTTIAQYGFNLRDAQATESRAWMVSECARWLNLPEYKLGGTKQPTFASVEQFARDFVDTTILPWTTRWEQRIEADLLVVDSEDSFVKFILDGLLRGSTLDRANAYALFIQNGILSENEVRVMEDRNPVAGLDEPRRSANQDRGGDPQGARAPSAPGPRPSTPAPADDDEEARSVAPAVRAGGADRRLRLIATAAAERVVRKEIAAVRAKAVKLASDPKAWAAWIDEFYAEHADFVADALQLEPAMARVYIDDHRAGLVERGLRAVAAWEQEAAATLVRLAVDGSGEAATPRPRMMTVRTIERDPETRLAVRVIEEQRVAHEEPVA